MEHRVYIKLHGEHIGSVIRTKIPRLGDEIAWRVFNGNHTKFVEGKVVRVRWDSDEDQVYIEITE